MDGTPLSPAAFVIRASAVAGCCALLTVLLPFRHVYAFVLGPAVLIAWTAAGMGLYGFVRYPSRQMWLAGLVALFVMGFVSWQFWRASMSLPPMTEP